MFVCKQNAKDARAMQQRLLNQGQAFPGPASNIYRAPPSTVTDATLCLAIIRRQHSRPKPRCPTPIAVIGFTYVRDGSTCLLRFRHRSISCPCVPRQMLDSAWWRVVDRNLPGLQHQHSSRFSVSSQFRRGERSIYVPRYREPGKLPRPSQIPCARIPKFQHGGRHALASTSVHNAQLVGACCSHYCKRCSCKALCRQSSTIIHSLVNM